MTVALLSFWTLYSRFPFMAGMYSPNQNLKNLKALGPEIFLRVENGPFRMVTAFHECIHIVTCLRANMK